MAKTDRWVPYAVAVGLVVSGIAYIVGTHGEATTDTAKIADLERRAGTQWQEIGKHDDRIDAIERWDAYQEGFKAGYAQGVTDVHRELDDWNAWMAGKKR